MITREKAAEQFIKDAATAFAARDYEESNRLAYIAMGIYNGAPAMTLWELYGTCGGKRS